MSKVVLSLFTKTIINKTTKTNMINGIRFPVNIIPVKNISYKKGICPVAEELDDETFIGIEICLFDYTDTNINEIIKAFKKIFTSLDKI